jgi:hypothetical protein
VVAQSADEACNNAKSYTTCEPGMCLKYTRTWLEIGSGAPDAITAWRNAAVKHPGASPPAGAPIFYEGGQYGHAALSLGGGKIRTTDAPGSGTVSTQDLDWPTDHWGYDYLGWTEDVNGTTIPYLKGTSGGGEQPGEGDEDMPLSDDDLAKIASKVWSHQLASDSVGTIMVRINPGPAGIAAATRDAVWSKSMYDPSVPGSPASAENLLRYARADSYRAAEQTESLPATASASAATVTSAAGVTGLVLAIGLALALVILVVAALIHATGGGSGEGLTEAERQVLTAGVGGLLALLGAVVGMRRS